MIMNLRNSPFWFEFKKGTANGKIEKQIPVVLFIVLGDFGENTHRDVCLHTNIMELDGTQLVVLKAFFFFFLCVFC